MKKRNIKRYAGEDESLVEDDDINRAVRAAQKPDVEELKRGIAAGVPAAEEEGNHPGINLALEDAAKPKSKRKTQEKPSRMERGSTAMKRGLATEPELPSGKATLEAGRATKDGSGLRSPIDTELARQKAREKIAAHRTQAESERSARKKAQDEGAGVRERVTSPSYSKFGRSPTMYEAEPGMAEYGLKKGGSASSRGDGIAKRGKTRGKMY